MKKLSSLKINELGSKELQKKEMNFLLGGGTTGDCRCGCNGSSSTNSNLTANKGYGYTETYGDDGNTFCVCHGGADRNVLAG